MTHRLSIICDHCGHEEHFTGHYTDTDPAITNLIQKEGWQRVAFTAAVDLGSLGHDTQTTTELYCPRCRIQPHTERDDHEIERYELLQELDVACACEDLTVAYNLVDRLFEWYGRTPRGEESTHAAAD